MFRKVLLFVLLFVSSHVMLGQPGDPNQDADAPITGVEILVALGGLFGVRQFLRKKK